MNNARSKVVSLADLAICVGLASRGRLDAAGADRWCQRSAQLLRISFHTLCRELAVMNLMEIGAHSAEVSVQFVESRGDSVSAYAFEANPHTFARKTIQASRAGVHVRQVALGRSWSPGPVELSIPLWNSSDDRLTPGNASLRTRVDDIEYERVPTGISSIDHEREALNIVGSTALWIDAEGCALEVLEGGANLLRSGDCDIIHVEVENTTFWQGQSTSHQVDTYLNSYDFSAVMRDAEFANQYNVIYLRNELIHVVEDHLARFWGALTRIRNRPLLHGVSKTRNWLRTVAAKQS